MSLDAREISKTFDSLVVLRNVSISVSTGEFVLLVGRSGAGKSTLGRILALVETAESGCISLDGTEYCVHREHLVRTPRPWPTVGFLFQQGFLWPHMRAIDNIALARSPKMSDDELGQLVKLLGIGHVLSLFPNQMSVGERQRVGLLRSLAAKPKYIIMDEPVSSVDPPSGLSIIRLLRDLVNEGIGVLVISHNVDVCFRLASTVYFLEQGEIKRLASNGRILYPLDEAAKLFLELSGVATGQER